MSRLPAFALLWPSVLLLACGGDSTGPQNPLAGEYRLSGPAVAGYCQASGVRVYFSSLSIAADGSVTRRDSLELTSAPIVVTGHLQVTHGDTLIDYPADVIMANCAPSRGVYAHQDVVSGTRSQLTIATYYGAVQSGSGTIATLTYVPR